MTTREQQEREVDVQRAMADLEQRVRRRRRLMGEPGGDAAVRDDIRNVADNWYVSAHLPITWNVPVVGRGLALAKRVTRQLLRWYINPVVDQQNDFNASVARAFVRVAAQQDAMAEALSALERRVEALEQARNAAEPGTVAGQGQDRA